MMKPPQTDVSIQAPIPEDPLPPEKEETRVKMRPLERIKLHPKVPPEPSSYGKYSNASRGWILQDGRESYLKGSEMKDKFEIPKKGVASGGIRRRLMTDFFWEQMLNGLVDELANNEGYEEEHCSEYDSNYTKEDFEPRNLANSADPTLHLKYPLYGTGSSATTFYSETIKKTNGEILEKFRKTQDFTKPIGERFDDGWVL